MDIETAINKLEEYAKCGLAHNSCAPEQAKTWADFIRKRTKSACTGCEYDGGLTVDCMCPSMTPCPRA